MQGDEARHEAAYQKIMDELMQRDPDSAVLAFADMMQASIVMPAHLMQDGGAGIDARIEREEAAYSAAVARRSGSGTVGQPHESDFFKGFAAVADKLGVYTAVDYAACVEHLLKRWRIPDLKVRAAAAALRPACHAGTSVPSRMRRRLCGGRDSLAMLTHGQPGGSCVSVAASCCVAVQPVCTGGLGRWWDCHLDGS